MKRLSLLTALLGLLVVLVPVSTQSTASAAPGGDYRGVVTADRGLVARLTPSRHADRAGAFRDGARIRINCKVRGSRVGGNRLWYLVSEGHFPRWVSARHVANLGAAPDYCDPLDGFRSARANVGLNQRAGASTRDARVGTFREGQRFRAQCYVGDSPRWGWIHTARGRWVSGSYVRLSGRLRYCMN